LNIPIRGQAEDLLQDAQQLNPGRWVDHSVMTGMAAGIITARICITHIFIENTFGGMHD
jgi:hypothetical protein